MAAEKKEIADWYNSWHLKNGVNAWRSPEAYIPLVDLLDAKPKERVLDVGCGTGFFLKAASDAGLDTHGVDISFVGIALSKQVSPESNVFVRSMQDLSGLGPFDYVTAFGSLEHCPDIEKSLLEIYNVLSPHGRFIAMVPNSDYDGPKMSVQDEIMETRKNLSEWKALFELAGFVVDDISEDMVMQRPDVPIEKTYQFIFKMSKVAA